MPNIDDLKKSRFLTKADVTPPKLVTIRSYDFVNVAMEGDAPDEKYILNFVELEKPMVLNSTNGDLIALATGSRDFDEWINKQIVLFVDPTVAMHGKVVGGIRVRAPKTKTTPASPAKMSFVPAKAPKAAPVPEPEPEVEIPADDDIPF
jgi:hypothetical protein